MLVTSSDIQLHHAKLFTCENNEIEIIFLFSSHEKVVSITYIAIIILTLQELKRTYYYCIAKALFLLFYTFKCTYGLQK